ncbi:hypothetical protein [Metapseudomonas resinovorans]|uniref:hypothetical protein n=1 Tax=Metapseudomonas resinovorans TaxID=53412 RepID=UPI00040B798E|nr:hypothetical protein [Pseudomonas resinovorans]MDE3737691.1 hypothetical protein [Pseudomonas resinovorans]
MKSAITTTALSSLLFSVVAFTSLQASSAPLQPAGQQPLLMLAEGGGDRLLQYREMQAQRRQTAADESERFAQLVEDKPTAAGSGSARETAESATKPATHYQSSRHQQSAEYEY